MAWVSSIPAAVTALVTLFEGALPGVWVTDGPAVGNDGVPKMVSVGWDGNEGAVLSETSTEGFDGDANRERFTVYCMCYAAGGDDPVAARDDAFALFAGCAAALAADRGLGGVVLRAVPGEVTVHQIAASGGRACRINFGVRVDAFTKES